MLRASPCRFYSPRLALTRQVGVTAEILPMKGSIARPSRQRCLVTSSRSSAQQRAAPAASRLAETAQHYGVSLKPLHQDFGVLIEGLNLTKPLDTEHQQLLHELWREHLLLVFRAGYLDPGSQERLLRYFPHDADALNEGRFGNAYFQPRVPSNPVLAVRGHNVTLKEHEGVKEEALKKCQLGGNPFDESRLWHMDMSDLPTPCEVSAMYMVHPAEDGGDDTIFASTEKMFEDLDEVTKKQILPLRTVNRKASEFQGFHMNWEGTRRLDEFEERLKQATEKGILIEPAPNPFVIKDPDNAKPAILVSAQRVYHFEGMNRADSVALLDKVLTHGTGDKDIYKHRWQPNDFAIWANRRLIHTASPAKGFSHTKDKMRLYHLVFLDSKKPILPANEA
ncbi:hypothetical protein ABBQ32_011921 [Trebouxia sp. C0010 RCD-2024]